jgi:hypothetical protein
MYPVLSNAVARADTWRIDFFTYTVIAATSTPLTVMASAITSTRRYCPFTRDTLIAQSATIAIQIVTTAAPLNNTRKKGVKSSLRLFASDNQGEVLPPPPVPPPLGKSSPTPLIPFTSHLQGHRRIRMSKVNSRLSPALHASDETPSTRGERLTIRQGKSAKKQPLFLL